LAAAAIAAGMIAAGGLAWLYAANSERAAATRTIPGAAAAPTGEGVQIQGDKSTTSSPVESTSKGENGKTGPQKIKAASPASTPSEAVASTTPSEGASKGEDSAEAKAHVKPSKKKIQPKSKE